MTEVRGLIFFITGYIIGILKEDKMSVVEVLVLTAVGALIGNIVGEILVSLYLKYIKHKKKK